MGDILSMRGLIGLGSIASCLFAAPQPAIAQGEPQLDDVVVVAHRSRCDLSIANRIMSDHEFRAKAAEWAAGRPVQVHVPASSSYACQARILFKLQRYGVYRAVFLDDGDRGGRTDE